MTDLNDFIYGVTIGIYMGSESVVEIPAEINGLPVTKIGSEAFFGCNNLTENHIPDSVKEIGKASFVKCEKLQCVYINISNWSKEELKAIFRYAEILPLE